MLRSITKQMADRRRRKAAGRRLACFVAEVVADSYLRRSALRKEGAGPVGVVVDGVRPRDVDLLMGAISRGLKLRPGQACGFDCAAVRLECPQHLCMERLEGRACREADASLGSGDALDHGARIRAYLERSSEETRDLRELLERHPGPPAEPAGEDFGGRVVQVDSAASAADVLAAAVWAVGEFVHIVERSGAGVGTLPADDRCDPSPDGSASPQEGRGPNTDAGQAGPCADWEAGGKEVAGRSCGGKGVAWELEVLRTAARMDLLLHPDGRKRLGSPDV